MSIQFKTINELSHMLIYGFKLNTHSTTLGTKK